MSNDPYDYVEEEPDAEEDAMDPEMADMFDAIDAGFFSGDSFHSYSALGAVEGYLARWQRQIAVIREQLDNPDPPAPTPEPLPQEDDDDIPF